MSNPPELTIADFVPGGVLPTDRIHMHTNDGTCSRCRVHVPDAQVSLMLFIGDDGLLIYCPACLDQDAPEGDADD